MKALLPVFFAVLLLSSPAQAADSLNVRLVKIWDVPGYAMGVALRGDLAFVVDWPTGGLRVISVADPAYPMDVGHVDIVPDSAMAVAVSGNYAYVANLSDLRVFSVADSAHPTEVGSFDTPGLAYRVAVSGNYAYVAELDSGLSVISISDPAHPTRVGQWHVSGSLTLSVAVAGHFVYLTDMNRGFSVISVADPANPQEVGHNDSVGFAGLAVADSYAYVGNSAHGISVVSPADSAHPVQVGWCDTHEQDKAVAIDDYVCALGSSRLCVVSKSDPSHPDTVGHYEYLGWNANGLATSGDYIYVASDHGLYICQRYDGASVEEATNAELRATNCGPTVVRGVLMLGAPGSRQNAVDRAELLDASGRKVAELHAGANDVSRPAPGVYFIREGLGFRGEGPGKTQKVVVTR